MDGRRQRRSPRTGMLPSFEKELNGDRLPYLLKAQIVLGHSSLTEQAAQEVENHATRSECSSGVST